MAFSTKKDGRDDSLLRHHVPALRRARGVCSAMADGSQQPLAIGAECGELLLGDERRSRGERESSHGPGESPVEILPRIPAIPLDDVHRRFKWDGFRKSSPNAWLLAIITSRACTANQESAQRRQIAIDLVARLGAVSASPMIDSLASARYGVGSSLLDSEGAARVSHPADTWRSHRA
jgi:hypothetical protein